MIHGRGWSRRGRGGRNFTFRSPDTRRAYGLLDSPVASRYRFDMLRKLAACLVLGVWVGLLAIELSEDLGLVAFANEQIEQAADDAVAEFGKAIPTESRPHVIVAQPWPIDLVVVRLADGACAFGPLLRRAPCRLLGSVAQAGIPLYQLFLDLRI